MAAATIALGADHAGFGLKDTLAAWLHLQGYEVLDLGTNGPARVDYPDFAHAVCAAVTSGRAARGILVCGSGVGMSIAANRHDEIRCVLAADATTARLARQHNDANVLALGARLIGEQLALDALAAFLAGEYEGGRHDARLARLRPPAETAEV